MAQKRSSLPVKCMDPLFLCGNSDPPCLAPCVWCCCIWPCGCCKGKVPHPDTMTHPTEADIAKQGTKCCKAADGRLIEYSVQGSTKPDAKVLVTGYYAIPASLTYPTQKTLESLNLREINISTPGYGWSTINPGYDVAEWPKTDVEAVFAAEGFTGKFFPHGGSAGNIHVLAMAQHFGDRVEKIGMRAPFLPLHVTKQNGLPSYVRYASTDEVLDNSKYARCCRWQTSQFAGYMPAERTEPMSETASSKAFPERMLFADRITARTMFHGHYGYDACSYNWARDVMTEVPNLDIPKIKKSGFRGKNKVVVWYGLDDEDCPPSHGQWLSEFLEAETRTVKGHGHVGAAVLVDHAAFITELVRTTGEPAAMSNASGGPSAPAAAISPAPSFTR